MVTSSDRPTLLVLPLRASLMVQNDVLGDTNRACVMDGLYRSRANHRHRDRCNDRPTSDGLHGV